MCTCSTKWCLCSHLGSESFLLVCYFYGCSCLRSSTELPLERAWVQWQFPVGACQGVFFVVIETLWVLCNCLVTHSFLCVSWWLLPHHFHTEGAKVKFTGVKLWVPLAGHCLLPSIVPDLWITALLLLSLTTPWSHGAVCVSVAFDKPGWSCQ